MQKKLRKEPFPLTVKFFSQLDVIFLCQCREYSHAFCARMTCRFRKRFKKLAAGIVFRLHSRFKSTDSGAVVAHQAIYTSTVGEFVMFLVSGKAKARTHSSTGYK